MCFSIRKSIAALTAAFVTLLCAGTASADWNINKPRADALPAKPDALPSAGLADAPAAGGAAEVRPFAGRTLATWTRGDQTMLLFSHEPPADVQTLLV